LEVEEVEEFLAVEWQLEVKVDHEAEGHNLINNMPNKRSSLEYKYHYNRQRHVLNNYQTALQPNIIILWNSYIRHWN
jgi:hypothetical protein